MNSSSVAIGGWLALLLFAYPSKVVAGSNETASAEFVGSTLGGERVQFFVGGLASNAPCHSVTWRMTLFTNQDSRQAGTFRLTAFYQVPTRSNPNRSEDGPKVAFHGAWEMAKGAKSRPEAPVYRFTASQPQRSLAFVQVGDHLLHLLNPDGTLAVGNGGWSYTLNRAERAEKPGDMSQVNNAPEISYKISPLATGPTVFGAYEGRTPCQGISHQLKLAAHAGCIKSKWLLTLYQNPETSKPTTYKVEGSLFRTGAREGTWEIVRGTAADANAVVYRLNPTQAQPALSFLKGDDNVLFFLDQKLEFMIGHGDFSYTLNRVPRN